MRGKSKTSARDIFNEFYSSGLTGSNSDETIELFCGTDNNHFTKMAKEHQLLERQIAAVIGFKDEFFVELLIKQVIEEEGLDEEFYCKKVTSGRSTGLSSRIVKLDGGEAELTVGGDCVIFRKVDNKPIMIIECKEYIDMIRMKELIGESRIIKDEISNSVNLLSDVKFCVFAEVLELTEGWSSLLNSSDLKYKIDRIFIMRGGKRKDRGNKPVKENLEKFRDYIQQFLLETRQKS